MSGTYGDIAADGFPLTETLTYVEYLSMRDFIKKKYDPLLKGGFDERDYAGHFTKSADGSLSYEAPYLDFWHWMLKAQFNDGYMHNGWFGKISFLSARDYAESKPEWKWAVEILHLYIHEFSDFWKDDADGFFYVHVWW